MGAKREIPTIPCWFSLFFLSPLVEFQGGRGGVCLQRCDFSKIYLFLSVLTLSAFQCAFYCFWSSASASFKKYSKRKNEFWSLYSNAVTKMARGESQ